MWTTKEAKLKNDIEAWKLECSLMHLKNLTSDTFAKVSLSKSRFVIGRYALNSARIHLISTISLLFLFRVNGIYTFLAIQWNSLRTPELTELHPLVNKLLRHKGTLLEKKQKQKYILTWLRRYHLAFLPLWDNLQAKVTSSNEPCLIVLSTGSSIHSNFSWKFSSKKLISPHIDARLGDMRAWWRRLMPVSFHQG